MNIKRGDKVYAGDVKGIVTGIDGDNINVMSFERNSGHRIPIEAVVKHEPVSDEESAIFIKKEDALKLLSRTAGYRVSTKPPKQQEIDAAIAILKDDFNIEKAPEPSSFEIEFKKLLGSIPPR